MEYIYSSDNPAVKSVSHINKLVKENPTDFINFVLKSTPQSAKEINADLKSYYKKVIQIEALLASMPVGKTPSDRLAGTIIELIIWAQLRDQVDEKIDEHVRTQVSIPVAAQIETQTNQQTGNQLRTQIWDHVEAHVNYRVWDHIEMAVAAQVWSQIEAQVDAQVTAKIGESLMHFPFASAKREGNLNDVIKSAVNYSFMVYQLGCLSMKHSEQMKKIQDDLSEYIAKKMTNEQISSAMVQVNSPQENEIYLTKTQLKMIRMHINQAQHLN